MLLHLFKKTNLNVPHFVKNSIKFIEAFSPNIVSYKESSDCFPFDLYYL